VTAGRRDLLGAVVSLAALAGVVWWASKQDAPTFPTAPGDLFLIAVAVALYAAATLLRGLRWSAILTRSGIEHRKSDAYSLVAVGYMGNTVLPARGGEVMRVLLMGERCSGNRRQVIGSIVAERLLDVVALLVLFAGMTWLGVAGTPTGQAPAAIGAGVAAAVAVAIPVYLRLRARGRLQRFADVLRPFSRASRVLLDARGFALLLLTLAVWLSEGVIFYLVGQSLGLALSVVDGTFLVVLASFFALIPAAPGYVGTFDAALLFGLDAMHVGGGPAVAFTLLARFVLFVPVTVAGLGLALTRYGGLDRLRRRRDEAAPA
jgi:uncharacterized membrane protein YbhN (UPF0104 family)